MFGKNLIHKRSVLIAVAVIALMTLTAGVAAAASMKAKNIEAGGVVTGLGLEINGSVTTKFKIKNDVIKSATVRTQGEDVDGFILSFNEDSCKSVGEHSEGVCADAQSLLEGAVVDSTHNSTAKLKVTAIPNAFQLRGTLRGNLKSVLTINGGNGDTLVGSATLRIRSTDEVSTYGCLLGVDPADFVTEIYGFIQACIDSPGPNNVGVYVGPLDGTGTYIGGGPVFVPTELHVVDTGRFKIVSDSTGTTLKGKIQITIDAPPVGVGVPAGTISITKGKATFPID